MGLCALLLAASSPAVPVPEFSASVVGISAVRDSAGVRLDWRVAGGSEFDPLWRIETRAADNLDLTVWKAEGLEVELGREPDVVGYRAWLPVPDAIDSLSVKLWAADLQERPSEEITVSVVEPPIAVGTPPIARRVWATAAEPVATGVRVKLVIRDTARYIVTAGEIAAALSDVDEATVRSWIAVTNLALTCMEEPVAWHPVGTNDAIAFIGMAYRDVFTDRNVYWIAPGPGLTMSETGAAAPPEPHEIGTFWSETRIEPDRELFEILPAERTLDAWYWDWVDTSIRTNKQSVLLPFAAPDAGDAGDAMIRLWARSFMTTIFQPPNGKLRLSISGQIIREFPVYGVEPEVLTCTFPQLLLEDMNALEVTVFCTNKLSTQRMRYALDSVTIGYRRRMMARDGQLLLTLAPGETNVVAGGFSSADIDVYAWGESGIPARLTGSAVGPTGATWQCAFSATEPAGRTLLLSAASRSPDLIEGVPVDPWAGNDHDVDYLVVSPEAFLPALQPLLALRAQQFRVGVVTAEDVYRDNNGGRSSPYALRELLVRTRSWRTPPDRVLLVGYGHYDYLKAYGTPTWQPNFVPPGLMDIPYATSVSGRWFFGTDNDLADLDDDGVPDLPIGRLPVRNEAELVRIVAKILSYENSRPVRTNAVAAADINPVDWNFKDNATSWNTHLPLGLARSVVSEPPSGTIEQKRQFIRDTWRGQLKAGLWLSAYFGHANERFLGESPFYLAYNDVASLENQGRTGILLGTTCIMNNVFKPYASLASSGCVGAELLLGSDGGMVAVLAPVSPSFEKPGAVLANTFADSIALRRHRHLGEGVVDALAALRESDAGSYWLTQTFLLLGDPALDLRPAETIFPGDATLLLLH
jgi:hypothetical protein